MGKLFTPKTSTVSDPGAAQAWGIAQGTHSMANRLGQDFTQQVMSPGGAAYGGPRVAALNPFQVQGANQLGSFSNQGWGTANTVTASGASMASQGASYGSNAGDIYRQATMDPSGYVQRVAGEYASSPYASGMVDAAARDVQRALNEGTLPTLALGASGGGNTNSTRAGVEAAIAQRGAADRIADTSAQIRGSLYQQGLQAGQGQWNQRLGNMLSGDIQYCPPDDIQN